MFNFFPWSAGHITDFNTATDKLNLSAIFSAEHYSGTNPVTDGWLIFQDDGSGNTLVYVNPHDPNNPYTYLITTLNGISAASITSQDYVFNSSGGAVTTRYFHTDNLGSVSVLTDENGNVVERDSYDTWGRRREPNGSDDPVLTGSITSQTTRGFTDQEELADVSLIHFNGRVYDPLIARFTSADPTVSQPDSSQGWNRYSYVGDNPLAFTDPDGYGFFSFLNDIFNPVRVFNETLAVTRAVYSIPVLGEVINVATIAASAYACGPCAIGVAAATASLQAGVTSGKFGVAFEAGLIAGAEAGAFYGVGAATTPGANDFGSAAYFENVAGHAAVGCTFATASGGSCGAGALAAGFGAAAGPIISTTFQNPLENPGNLIGGTIASATIGGVGSVLGGGKFENGAVTAAFAYLLNEELHSGGLNGNGYSPQAGDNTMLARAMFSEAAGSPDAYADLGWTIVDRVGAPGFPDSLIGVVYQTDVYGRFQIQGVGTPLWYAAVDPSDLTGPNVASYARALGVANGILTGQIPNQTGGATFFYSGPMPHDRFFRPGVNSGKLVPTATAGPFTFLRQQPSQ